MGRLSELLRSELELDLEWWVDTGKAYIEKEQQEPGRVSREMAFRVTGAWRAWSGPESHLVWCNRSREYMRNRKWRTRKIKWPRIRLQGLFTPPLGLHDSILGFFTWYWSFLCSSFCFLLLQCTDLGSQNFTLHFLLSKWWWTHTTPIKLIFCLKELRRCTL